MTETVVKRRLVVTSDTSDLAKGAAEVERFGRATSETAKVLAAAKGNLGAAEYKVLADALGPVIKAEEELAKAAKHAADARRQATEEDRKAVAEQARQEAAAQKMVLNEQRRAEAMRMRYDVSYRNAKKYGEIEDQVARMIEQRNMTLGSRPINLV